MKRFTRNSLSAAFVVALLSVSSVANAQDDEVAVKDAAVATFEDLTWSLRATGLVLLIML